MTSMLLVTGILVFLVWNVPSECEMFAFWVCIVSRDREFITRNYVDLKALNPTLPLLIRECSGVQPRLWARYGQSVHPIDIRVPLFLGFSSSSLMHHPLFCVWGFLFFPPLSIVEGS